MQLRLKGVHLQPVRALDLLGDRALSCVGNTAVVWSLNTGDPIQIFTKHDNPILQCKLFYFNTALLAATCSKEGILIWECSTGNVLQISSELRKVTYQGQVVDFDPCNSNSANIEFDDTCDEIKLTLLQQTVIVFTNQTQITCAKYFASKRMLCSSDRDGTIKRMFVSFKEQYSFDRLHFTFDSHSSQVNLLCLSADGTYCLSASDDLSMFYFDLFPQERSALVALCQIAYCDEIKPWLKLVKQMLM